MARFTDARGREWTIDLDVAMLERVRSETGIDLLALVDGKLAEVLYADLSATASAICIASKPASPVRQLRAKIVTAICAILPMRIASRTHRHIGARFKKAMDGDALERAADALMESLIDFFPNARRRKVLRATWNWTRENDAGANSALLSLLSSPPTIAANSSGATPE